jgi:hypothetical protein
MCLVSRPDFSLWLAGNPIKVDVQRCCRIPPKGSSDNFDFLSNGKMSNLGLNYWTSCLPVLSAVEIVLDRSVSQTLRYFWTFRVSCSFSGLIRHRILSFLGGNGEPCQNVGVNHINREMKEEIRGVIQNLDYLVPQDRCFNITEIWCLPPDSSYCNDLRDCLHFNQLGYRETVFNATNIKGLMT